MHTLQVFLRLPVFDGYAGAEPEKELNQLDEPGFVLWLGVAYSYCTKEDFG